jgi:hypothetical protein
MHSSNSGRSSDPSFCISSANQRVEAGGRQPSASGHRSRAALGTVIMTELCFNIWYYVDRSQNIVAIAAKAYLLDGADEDKAIMLKHLSRHDYRTVDASPVPVDIRNRYPQGLWYGGLKDLGIEHVYKEVFERIRRTLPKGFPFPEDKLFFATALYDFGEGFFPAEVGNGFIRNRD